ncbi:hypothetical protein predicted by Glimmer/Critica [Acetobacter senegalensis]|uniref:Uncharacterized protein n=2 Tax=Acetobacter TaxID=434 RepID=A0A0U5EWC9_9PROT|nr:hypothetical protein ATPR_0397 [Acetobacter tropicalis NBRC 101654]CEF40839.1 hypothetical protein predicted by Glimmer/Critica [Acetobacter senegalensis]
MLGCTAGDMREKPYHGEKSICMRRVALGACVIVFWSRSP